MFSSRTCWDLRPNPFSQQLEALREGQVPLLDLTESNPTRVGIRYPSQIAASFIEGELLTYRPDPQGDVVARRAVASIYQKKGVEARPEEIVLTASTSEAYDFLFRLLTNPGDRILVPTPSYPLLTYLADLNNIEVRKYPLRYQGSRWRIDWKELSLQAKGENRLLVLIHPNHPTGSGLTDQEWEKVVGLCREQSMALIVDEVFADYRWEGSAIAPTLAGNPEVLTFALGGLSKFMGLPQMKLAWILASGPRQERAAALERLQMIADTFLSVNTPVQKAFPLWLDCADEIQTQIRQRLAENRHCLLDQARQGRGLQCLSSDGGWSALLRIPGVEDGQLWVLRLLEEKQVAIHPGYFFDFEEEDIFVVSLLTPPDIFEEGIRRLVSAIPGVK